ncbi:MAG: CoA-binding protein [Thermobacillus sp.]|uniref:Putative CoA-binding protein n=1 Tax=Thermobacillus composti (strain DSM 18247 / JCM 13945 / KWC4) TaxID=717605 RepID=L0EGR2_THECK|nr:MULTISPECIES: CoA-binding protein [Thermobacillus]AGA58345.1 putative CoA-binding protein [Thermobacillus composti KWC4]REK58491.1 MAG: CoA-binding protein [Thermobacillus sp.]
MSYRHPDRETIKRILEESDTIAVVGLSDNPERTSHMVAAAMQAKGYRIVPVNPNADTILGEKCYKSLKDIPFPVDLVNVFRRSEYCADVAREAAEIGAKTLWLQLGIVSEEAAGIAEAAGMNVIMDRCIKVEDSILLPEGKTNR